MTKTMKALSGLLGLLLVVLSATAARADGPRLTSQTKLTVSAATTVGIYARGADAWVRIDYICPKRWTGYAITDVLLSESLPNGKTTGGGSDESPYLTCDDLQHSLSISVPAANWAFNPGQSADVRTDTLACNADESKREVLNTDTHATMVTGNAPPTTSYIAPTALLLKASGQVAVELDYQCSPGEGFWADADVTQRLPGRMVTGSSNEGSNMLADAQCDNHRHSRLVDLAPAVGPPRSRFAVGSAWVHLFLQVDSPQLGITQFDLYRVVRVLPAGG